MNYSTLLASVSKSEPYYKITQQANESSKAVNFYRQTVAAEQAGDLLAGACLVSNGNLVSTLGLRKGAQGLELLTVTGKVIPLGGDLLRSTLVNILASTTAAQIAEHVEVYIFDTDKLESAAQFAGIDMQVVDTAREQLDWLEVVKSKSIFDADCGDCGTGRFCGSWSRICRGSIN